MFKKTAAMLLILCFVTLIVTGCGKSGSNASKAVTNLPQIDMTKWHYSADNKLYYQAELSYCEKPADETYEKLAIFIPAAYMDATDNGDGTYTCQLNNKEQVNGYTASKAPIVMPIETLGYAAAEALQEDMVSNDDYIRDFLGKYTDQGFIYVHAGCRGVKQTAPSGVTDLKAAIRYLRYNDNVIAGDTDSIFVFGMSGGGAQSAIIGSSGDSTMYDPYLEAIGAVQGVSDAVAGSMDWCPVMDFATGDAEYEWMMGCTHVGQTEEEKAISDGLAYAYADYVNNKAGFTDKDGNKLTLEKSDTGIYQAGSYYEYIKSVIEESLNNYLSDTDFTPKTAQDYIDSLNKDKKWITYDKSTNTATITSIEDFVKNCKRATDNKVAFDWLNNNIQLFSPGEGKGAHFDRLLADVLDSINNENAAEYYADLEKTDFVGYTVEQRLAMYSPRYYLMPCEDGYKTSKVAKYWRIRSGIEQPTTSLTTEVNLAIALEQYDGVKSVDFATVWEQNHVEAERVGDSKENFIKWVDACMKD